MERDYLFPHWVAPRHIQACTSLRQGGMSQGPYSSFNLALHVGDDPKAVNENIKHLVQDLELPRVPHWLTQVHGTHALNLDNALPASLEADACYTSQSQTVCAVLTADCLPLLVCNRQGSEVAAIHAGWKGLLAGVITTTIQQLKSQPTDLLVWLGPAIGPEVFEVTHEIMVDFTQANPDNSASFRQIGHHRWFADLYELARTELRSLGVEQIYGGEHCTVTESEAFFSYRRDQGRTGRMASLIWIT